MSEPRETDREKFVRLANARVNKAISAIRIIGNLSNKSNYSYNEDDVEKIFRALQEELKTCRRRFSSEKPGGKDTFKIE
jgi:hypothetical protein